MILNDRQIKERCESWPEGMIIPFNPKQVGKPSAGLGYFGYDISLGDSYMRQTLSYGVLDPLIDNACEWSKPLPASDGVVLIEPGETILVESMEMFSMPKDVIGICVGKSSLARLGLLTNITPLEPGWIGKLTMELSNLNVRKAIRLHVGKGIAQVLFFAGDEPERMYGGLYQYQKGVTLPR